MSRINRIKRVMIARNHGFTYYAFVVMVSIMMILHCTSALSLDFVTQEDFEADEVSYKDYPLRLLFKKLAESDPSEKAVIRNYIILKQVFDQNTIKIDKTGVVEFDKSYGTIKEITENNLKLWIPETNNVRNYFVGLDRIPTEKAGKYMVTESNISNYACVIYSLDGRVYKIKIDFLIAPPDQLNVEREGRSNIVSWSVPTDDKKPHMYKLFRNGELYETIEGNSAKVPREKGIIDNYYVRSVYRHGQDILESDSSKVLYDEITAKERQNELIASEMYTKIKSALSGQEYETAKRILYDAKELLYTYLDDENREQAKSLTAFFNDIDEGDRLITEKSDNLNTLEMAIRAFEKAKFKAEMLPEELNTAILAQAKINESNAKKLLLEDRNKETLAVETYNKIIAHINGGDYENSLNILSENKSFLNEFLEKEKKSDILHIEDFFTTIDRGDRIIEENPDSMDSIISAIDIYKQAKEKAAILPDSINVITLAEIKISSATDKKMIVETKNKETIANKIYDDIIAAINPDDYEKARRALYDNSALLDEYLNQSKKSNIRILMEIFNDIDEGDKLGLEEPATTHRLGMALRHYQKAGQTAAQLPSNIDINSIIQLKIKAGEDRQAMLERRDKELIARETYNKIIESMKPLEWENGKKILNDNIDSLSQYLPQDKKGVIDSLMNFFNELEKGDRLGRETPETKEKLDNALTIYSDAGEIADAFSHIVNVRFISDQKIKDGLNRKTNLEIRNKRTLAREKYEEIIVNMNPEQWENGKGLLIENIQIMNEFLDEYSKENTVRLMEFFQDIEEGDRISKTLPATVEVFENAVSLYKRAEQKASNLPDEIDLLFITKERINECRNKITRLEEDIRQREALEAAREREKEVQKEEEDTGVRILTTTLTPVDESERESILESAMKKFDKRDYIASWNDFLSIYRKQINNIIKGGQYRIMGVLGLPVRYRAEIFFLIELEDIKNKGEEITEEELEEIKDRIDNSEGMWTIIQDTSAIRKIKHHIANFDLDSGN